MLFLSKNMERSIRRSKEENVLIDVQDITRTLVVSVPTCLEEQFDRWVKKLRDEEEVEVLVSKIGTALWRIRVPSVDDWHDFKEAFSISVSLWLFIEV
jgi:hypothetical protein